MNVRQVCGLCGISLRAWLIFVGLSYEDREEYATFGQDASMIDIDNLNLYPIPPGEEGTFGSNAGGEEELCRKIFMGKQYVIFLLWSILTTMPMSRIIE